MRSRFAARLQCMTLCPGEGGAQGRTVKAEHDVLVPVSRKDESPIGKGYYPCTHLLAERRWKWGPPVQGLLGCLATSIRDR